MHTTNIELGNLHDMEILVIDSLSFDTWIIEWTFDHSVFVSRRGLECYMRFLLSANQFILVVFFCQFHKGRSDAVWAPFASPSSQSQNQVHRRICARSNNKPTISLILIWTHNIDNVAWQVTDGMIVVVRRQDDMCPLSNVVVRSKMPHQLRVIICLLSIQCLEMDTSTRLLGLTKSQMSNM